MIHAHNLVGDQADKDFGPNGWYSGSVTTAGSRIFYNSTATLTPASPGDHTSDLVNSKLTVVTGAGSLNRVPGFACTTQMPRNCWQYTSAGQSVVVNVLTVPIALQAQVGGAAVTSHVTATQVTFQWYMPDWAQNASGPAGGTPYKTRRWTWYPDGGTPVVLPFATTDSGFRYRQYQVTQSGRMEVEVRINGEIKTSSATVVVRCIMKKNAQDSVGTLLDNKVLADSMEAGWDLSNYGADPTLRREQGGTVYTDPVTGKPAGQNNFNDPLNTPCDSREFSDSTLSGVVIWHAHPFDPNETPSLPSNCGPDEAGQPPIFGPGKKDFRNLPSNAKGAIVDPKYAWVYYPNGKRTYRKRKGAGCTYP